MTEHSVTYEWSGDKITDYGVPVCTCGWQGRKEYNHNDHCHTNLREQAVEHIKRVQNIAIDI